MIVSGRVMRVDLNEDSFATLTGVPLVAGGLRADGVEFAGDLTAAEALDVWWFITSRNDADEAARRNLAAMRDNDDPGLCAALVAYVLGES